MQENTQTLENAAGSHQNGQPALRAHARDVVMRPEFPRKAFFGHAQDYAVSLPCCGIASKISHQRQSLQIPSRSTSFFPLEMAAAHTGLFSLQLPLPQS